MENLYLIREQYLLGVNEALSIKFKAEVVLLLTVLIMLAEFGPLYCNTIQKHGKEKYFGFHAEVIGFCNTYVKHIRVKSVKFSSIANVAPQCRFS